MPLTVIFFFSLAHKFDPELVMSGLSFMGLSSPFWNPWTAFLARIMNFSFYSIHCSFTPLRFFFFLGGGSVFYWKNSEQLQSIPAVYILALSPSGFTTYREVILFKCVTWRDPCHLLSIQVSFLCAAFQLSC